jgi:DMSO/TMAO reductase YedYZ molybdopterin-dependent catalytic subunit
LSEQNQPREQMRKLSRRSLLWAGAAILGGIGGFRWLGSRRDDAGVAWPLRRSLQLNEEVWSDAFSKTAMAPTFDKSQVSPARFNGGEGMINNFDPKDWRLQVEGVYDSDGPMTLTLEDIKKLPRHEFTTQLCCIEGWSVIVTWAGARFSDFAAKYMPPPQGEDAPSMQSPQDLVKYVYMETPDKGYYVGLDMQSMLHPQTLLCYEMNGKQLEIEHGAPLRLVIPVKYGIKNIKRIGLIRYTNIRPADYWAEQGYDWYAGL